MLADVTPVLVFNHWFKNILVQKLGESHTTEREMLQQFGNIRLSGKKKKPPLIYAFILFSECCHSNDTNAAIGAGSILP